MENVSNKGENGLGEITQKKTTQPMKVIYSYAESNYGKQIGLKTAALSNFLVKSQGFHTTFYGDKKSLERFSNIAYDDFKLVDEKKLTQIPARFWSRCKLLAIQDMDTPFLHIDCDILPFKEINPTQYDHDIVCLNKEDFMDRYYSTLQAIYKIRPPETEGQPTRSFNYGIIGGNDFESLKKAMAIITEFSIKHSKHIENVEESWNDPEKPINIVVLAEQVWTAQILMNQNKTIHTIVPIENYRDDVWLKTKQYGILHLMCWREDYQTQIDKMVIEYNIAY